MEQGEGVRASGPRAGGYVGWTDSALEVVGVLNAPSAEARSDTAYHRGKARISSYRHEPEGDAVDLGERVGQVRGQPVVAEVQQLEVLALLTARAAQRPDRSSSSQATMVSMSQSPRPVNGKVDMAHWPLSSVWLLLGPSLAHPPTRWSWRTPGPPPPADEETCTREGRPPPSSSSGGRPASRQAASASRGGPPDEVLVAQRLGQRQPARPTAGVRHVLSQKGPTICNPSQSWAAMLVLP